MRKKDKTMKDYTREDVISRACKLLGFGHKQAHQMLMDYANVAKGLFNKEADVTADTVIPDIGSVWIYKNDPARIYKVVAIANTGNINRKHPPFVVYVTYTKPSEIWVRTIPNFFEVMTANGE